MVDILKQIDPGLLMLKSGSGDILVSNKLQGRVFAAFDGEIVHRFLTELAKNPDPVEFNNIGGNSLWPGPEGGDFAFNYPPGGEWRVQAGINSVETVTVKAGPTGIVVKKFIELENRKGKTARFEFRRTITPLTAEELAEFPAGIKCCGYHSVDELIPQEEYSCEDVLCCPWSLEQFPGAEGIIGFGRCAESAENCANSDFYGDPGERLQYAGRVFKFLLGGKKRLQIGIKADKKPELIGAFDEKRGILALRMTPFRNDGKYINIADNDQSSGPYGAADMFSIFNGSQELDFFELETIAPMSVANGVMQPCRLESVSLIFKGDKAALLSLLKSRYDIAL